MAETYKTPQEHPLYELAKKYKFNPNIKIANPNALKIELDRIVKYVKMKFDQNKLSEEDKATYQRYLQDQEAEKTKKAEEAEKQEATAVGAPSAPSPEPESAEKNATETTAPASEPKSETKTPKTKLDTPENPLMKERFYRLALRLKEAGIEIWDISKYDASNPDFGTQINKDLNDWIRNNKPEVNAQALAVFPKSSKLYHALEQKIKRAQKNKTEDTHHEKKEEKSMEEKTEDLSTQLKASDAYKNAAAAGIDVSGYAPKTKEEYDAALKDISQKMKEKENSSEMPKKDDKETTDKENPDENTLIVSAKSAEPDENINNAWIEDLRLFWQQHASESGMTYAEDDAENKSKTSLAFGLALNNELKSKIEYSSPDHVALTADSPFMAYQGIVKDAHRRKFASITNDSSLTETQQLMLYAAVLENKNIQMINAPKINLDSDAFKSLDKNVQNILKEEIERQKQNAKAKEIQDHLHELQAKIDARKAAMSPEERAKREQREAELNAIRNARLGKTGTYNQEVKDKDGNVIKTVSFSKDDDFIKAYNERQAIITRNTGRK
ncbi:MAG: hypothetical protein IJ870_06110 [Alphaproteobacteria bacterium]|nr:hypothetical protein [Alphaproteobacteria bacterium]